MLDPSVSATSLTRRLRASRMQYAWSTCMKSVRITTTPYAGGTRTDASAAFAAVVTSSLRRAVSSRIAVV